MHVERAQRGMRGRKIGMDHLPHALGTTEVLQPVRTQVGQVHAVRQLIDDQSGGCVRHEDLVTDLPDLPTEGGPSEKQYVDVATAFAEAARDGDCDEAREYANDAFNESMSDENLCEGTTQSALKDDDFDDYEIEFFGTYGALVTFDDGQTNVSLVSQESGDPLVAVLHRLLTSGRAWLPRP